MTYSLRSLLFITAGVSILCASAIGLLRLKNQIEEDILNSYRLSSTGHLFIEYKDINGKWPKNWKDIEAFVISNGSQVYGAEDVDELREHITIDFSIDLLSIDASKPWSDSDPQLRIVSAKTGQTYGATSSPNESIYFRLQSDALKTRTTD